jgi:hypothetical protein
MAGLSWLALMGALCEPLDLRSVMQGVMGGHVSSGGREMLPALKLHVQHKQGAQTETAVVA